MPLALQTRSAKHRGALRAPRAFPRAITVALLLALFLLAPPAQTRAADSFGFLVAPYLTEVTQDSAVVAFLLKEPAAATVRVFFPDGPRDFSSEKPQAMHFIAVSGLSPQTAYRYEASGPGFGTPKNDASYEIRTACLRGESYSFAVYGDTRPGDTGTNVHHRDVMSQVLFTDPSFCLALGDLVDDGSDMAQWEAFFAVENPVLRRTPLFPVLGDNDIAQGRGLATRFFPWLDKGYYSFAWGGTRFIGLSAWDTRGLQSQAELSEGSQQTRWLVSELSKPDVQEAAFRVVFLHDPVYISRGRAAEVMRRVWAPLFEKYRVDVVFASWHLYERMHVNGVAYIITGGAGAEILWMNKNPAFPSQAEAARHHFCRVDVNQGSLTIRAVADDGTVLDSITLAPRGQAADSAEKIERLAKRLGRTVNINARPGLPVMDLHLFSYDCSYCKRLLGRELPEMARKNGVALRVFHYDLGLEGSYDLFLNAGARFGRQDSDLPAVFAGKSVLGGESEIETGLPRQMEEFAKSPERYRDASLSPFSVRYDTKTMGEKAFDALTLPMVLGAGLLDGINPCAFATIIFLVSYLSLFGASTRRVVATGLLFSLSVFCTYFAIGLAFFHSLKSVLAHPGLAFAINGILLIIVEILAILSARDLYLILSGRREAMALKLPERLRNGIQKRVRSFAENRAAAVGAPIVLGVVISAMELTCTGQVYVPIVAMIAEPARRGSAVFYLLLYNLAFILPLLAVFALALMGRLSAVSSRGRRATALVKLGNTLFFLVMGWVLLHNMNVV
ncbi:MAG: cytochrome c biogenesis protein CcdA [Thermodesulfobacteriota bacterium]